MINITRFIIGAALIYLLGPLFLITAIFILIVILEAGKWAIIGIGLFLSGMVILALGLLYNSVISRKNQVNNSFAGLDAMLKKRYDLIPNLVSTVQTYMQYESDLLTRLTDLRVKAVSGVISEDDRIELDNKITRAVKGLMVAVENYPELKAGQNFLQLQAALNEVEDQLSAGRRAYNAAVMLYNNAVEMFPTNIMAWAIGYDVKKFFEISEKERANIDVKRLFSS